MRLRVACWVHPGGHGIGNKALKFMIMEIDQVAKTIDSIVVITDYHI